MNMHPSRRRFLQGLALGGIAMHPSGPLAPTLTGAVEPILQPPSRGFRLGLAAYSFRDFFLKGKPGPSGKPVDMKGFIDYCAEHRCDAELTSYYFEPGMDEAGMLEIRRHAFLRGVVISGTAVGNTFTHAAGEARDKEMAGVKRWVDLAASMGAPHIRVFAGSVPKGLPVEVARRNTIAALEEAGEYAGRKGIFLGVENHGGIVPDAAGLLAVIQAVKSRWVGINLDTGNFNTPDPFLDLERCAPYAVNVQYKAEMKPQGQASRPTDTARVIGILRRAGYPGVVTLEYESAESPWTAVPRLLEDLRRHLG